MSRLLTILINGVLILAPRRDNTVILRWILNLLASAVDTGDVIPKDLMGAWAEIYLMVDYTNGFGAVSGLFDWLLWKFTKRSELHTELGDGVAYASVD